MHTLTLLTFAVLLGNTLAKQQKVLIRVDSRDPDVIQGCNGFKIHCPQVLPENFEPLHYMANNLKDEWGATWKDKAHATEYINRFAPMGRAWIYWLEVKDRDVPEEITHKNQPDISRYPFSKVIEWVHSSHHGIARVPNPEYSPGLWALIRQSVKGGR